MDCSVLFCSAQIGLGELIKSYSSFSNYLAQLKKTQLFRKTLLTVLFFKKKFKISKIFLTNLLKNYLRKKKIYSKPSNL